MYFKPFLFLSCHPFNVGEPLKTVRPTQKLQSTAQSQEPTGHTLLELTTENTCTNPCTFEAKAVGVTTVRYSADEWVIGVSSSLGNSFAVTHQFQNIGTRIILVEAMDENGNILAQDSKLVTVSNQDFRLISPSSCDTPCPFKAKGPEFISTVYYYSDEWLIGQSSDSTTDFQIDYDFNTLGNRYIVAHGISEDGKFEVEAGRWIEVNGTSDMNENPNVPYYYQYANTLNPSGSCQNSSLAMLLSYSGHTIHPDDITAEWGTQFAQSPSGLAEVYNHYSREASLSKRLVPVTNGTLSDLKNELSLGQPVIIHGYFTVYGHIVVVLGFDDEGYWVNDPAGEWSQSFGGGYSQGWQPTIGHGIYYTKEHFEAAVATSDGRHYLPLWYHLLR